MSMTLTSAGCSPSTACETSDTIELASARSAGFRFEFHDHMAVAGVTSRINVVEAGLLRCTTAT